MATFVVQTYLSTALASTELVAALIYVFWDKWITYKFTSELTIQHHKNMQKWGQGSFWSDNRAEFVCDLAIAVDRCDKDSNSDWKRCLGFFILCHQNQWISRQDRAVIKIQRVFRGWNVRKKGNNL